jgi:hypothetical protein
MTFFEAALQVLRSSKQPLTVREITNRALEGGLVASGGKTPYSTMSAILYRQLAPDSPIVKVDNGLDSVRLPGGRSRASGVRWKLRGC